jgi:short-subunit dehydrogenase
MAKTQNDYALVTGASSGIGRETTLALAHAGFSVIAIGRSQAKLDTLVYDIETLGGHAIACSLDFAQVDHIQPQIAKLADQYPIGVLVNNAGVGYTAPLVKVPLADWQTVLNVNLTSVLQCIQGVLPGMRDRQHGTIVNVVSIAGQQVFPDWGAYSVSKFGLMALTKTLALEERQHGIRVSAICPGSVNTPLWDTETVQADFNRDAMLTADVVAQSILHIIRLPPGAVIEELTLMPHAGTF